MFKPLTLSLSLVFALSLTGVSKAGGFHKDSGCATCGIASAQGPAVSPQTAAQLTTMMTKVVQQGTGTNGQIANVAVAGKTGTAQQGGGRPPHAWFISFAPADTDPLVAVAVVVEDGGGSAEISGNGLAAPIARAVMQAVLSHR